MINDKSIEEQWQEDFIVSLPVEDDRFEFKVKIDENLQDLAKEICAFANSFGGTLFLGVKDKTHEIIGVPKKFPIGSRSDTIEWLERKVPQLLLFRFNAFRIRPVKLKSETQKLIGGTNTVISIDVFDSDSAPYQVAIRGEYDRRYFYRENSSAGLAPHSHLAYLWLRNSADKTRVIQHLITNFLSPLIKFVESVNKDFTEFRFYHINFNGGDYIKLEFFSWTGWKNNIQTLAAEQFLRQEDSVNLKETISKLSDTIKDFEIFIKTFSETVLEKAAVDIRKLDKKFKLNNDSGIFSESTARILTYIIFDLKSNMNVATTISSLNKYFRENVLPTIKADPYFKSKKRESKKRRLEIVEITNQLLEQAKDLRHELCLRYNTIYSDTSENLNPFLSNSPFK